MSNSDDQQTGLIDDPEFYHRPSLITPLLNECKVANDVTIEPSLELKSLEHKFIGNIFVS